MKTYISKVFFSLILIISFLNFTSCSNREETISCFPNTPINVILNLNLPTYFALQNVNGWIYVNEQQSGTRGLIIIRTANGFKVYDRNAPHLCPDQTTTLSVEDNIRIVCPKDGAEWILYTGEPQKIAKVPPKTYPYSFDPYTNTLSVYY